MKRRLLSYILILVIVFGATVPSFAVTESLVTGFSNPSLSNTVSAYQTMVSIVNYLASLDSKLPSTTSGGTVFDDIKTDLVYLVSWLTPAAEDGLRPSTTPSLWQIMIELGTAAYQYLPELPQITSYITSWMQSNNGFLNKQVEALTNINPGGHAMTVGEIQRNAHRSFVSELAEYTIDFFSSSDGNKSTNTYNWQAGSPIGNIGLLVQKLNQNVVNSASSLLYHFNDTLTTWEHSTNTQTTFTPTSLANGLYRYLAYIQSDTSWIGYKLLSDLPQSFSYFTQSGNKQTASKTSLAGLLSDIAIINYRYMHGLSGNGGLVLGQYAYTNKSLTSTSQGYYSTDGLIISGFKSLTDLLAPLTFVHANDDDIAAMRAAQQSGVDGFKTKLYDSSNGGVTLSSLTDTFNTGTAAKQAFNSGATFSTTALFGFTDDGNWGFWSQAVKDDMDTVAAQQTRLLKSNNQNEYNMSLYEDRLEILSSIYTPAQGVQQEEGEVID